MKKIAILLSIFACIFATNSFGVMTAPCSGKKVKILTGNKILLASCQVQKQQQINVKARMNVQLPWTELVTQPIAVVTPTVGGAEELYNGCALSGSVEQKIDIIWSAITTGGTNLEPIQTLNDSISIVNTAYQEFTKEFSVECHDYTLKLKVTQDNTSPDVNVYTVEAELK